MNNICSEKSYPLMKSVNVTTNHKGTVYNISMEVLTPEICSTQPVWREVLVVDEMN